MTAVEAGLFLSVALWAGDGGTALRIALGELNPFSTRADLVAVPLAVVSVFFAPAIVGAVVALVIDRQLQGMRRSETDVEQWIREQLTRQLEARHYRPLGKDEA